MINLSKNWLLTTIVVGLLVVAIPVSLYLVRQQQNIRSRAAQGAFPAVVLSPDRATENLNVPFNVDVEVNAIGQDLSAFDIQLTFDSSVLQYQGFSYASPFTGLNSNQFNGANGIHIVAVNSQTAQPTNNSIIKVGTITFKPIQQGTSGQVNFIQGQVWTIAQSDSYPILAENNANPLGVYTVNAPTGATNTPIPSATNAPAATNTPIPTAIPSATPIPTLGPVSCNSFTINGSQTPTIPGGSNASITINPIPNPNPPSNATVNFSVSANPSSAPTLTTNQIQTGSNPTVYSWSANVPINNTATENVYTITASINTSSGNITCPNSVMVHVAATTADNQCPSTITSTQVKLRAGSNTGAWLANRSITMGDTVVVAGFHNNDTPDTPPGDTTITVTGPNGFSRVFTAAINPFTPSADAGPGTYFFNATTNGKVGANCSTVAGATTLTVSAVPTATPVPTAIPTATPTPTPTTVLLAPVTTTVRIAESAGGLADGSGLFVDLPYTQAGLVVPYNFRDKTPGVKQIWVKFFGKGTRGEDTVSDPQGPFEITIVNPDPTFNVPGGGVSCDLGVDGGVRFTLTGKHFGDTQGLNGLVKNNSTLLKINSWSDNSVSGSLDQAGAAGQDFPIVLTRDDGAVTNSTICSVATSALQLGANFFCRQSLNQPLSNVELTIAEGKQGGNVNTETVNIGTNGLISGLKTRFQQGKPYRIGIKAPGSLRKVVEFTANKGTTNLGSLDLPVGDIFPLNGDGKINSNDYAELLREWALNAITGGRNGDLNLDGRVNSFDWACMRPYINVSDDLKPEAGPLTSTITPTPTSTTSSTPTPTPAPTAGGSSGSTCPVSRNDCNLNLTNGQTLSDNNGITLLSSGTGQDPAYRISVWLVNSKSGDYQLLNHPVSIPYQSSGGFAFYYNNGPATIQCRVSTTQTSGTICTKNYNVNISN